MSLELDELQGLALEVASYLRAKADAENRFGVSVPYELAERLEAAVATIREQEQKARSA